MGMTPVTVLDAAGHLLELPWDTPLPTRVIDALGDGPSGGAIRSRFDTLKDDYT